MTTLLHPDRYHPTNYTDKEGVVVHTSESNDDTYPVLLRLLQSPGDRGTAPNKWGSGYHAITQGIDWKFTEVAGADCAPNAAPPFNDTWWHICIPGRANQTREEWLDPISRAHIRGVAIYIYQKHSLGKIPLIKRGPAQLQTGYKGYCGHGDVSKAFGKTNHTDPGDNFPWDILHYEISLLVKEDDSMPKLVRFSDDAAVFIQDGNNMIWAISQQVINARYTDGTLNSTVPSIIDPITRKTYTLVGKEPNYDGVTSPHRIYGSDFAVWVKP